MSSSSTIKTTVRLPADLHWQFQGERTKRRLSNEKAIAEAHERGYLGKKICGSEFEHDIIVHPGAGA